MHRICHIRAVPAEFLVAVRIKIGSRLFPLIGGESENLLYSIIFSRFRIIGFCHRIAQSRRAERLPFRSGDCCGHCMDAFCRRCPCRHVFHLTASGFLHTIAGRAVGQGHIQSLAIHFHLYTFNRIVIRHNSHCECHGLSGSARGRIRRNGYRRICRIRIRIRLAITSLPEIQVVHIECLTRASVQFELIYRSIVLARHLAQRYVNLIPLHRLKCQRLLLPVIPICDRIYRQRHCLRGVKVYMEIFHRGRIYVAVQIEAHVIEVRVLECLVRTAQRYFRGYSIVYAPCGHLHPGNLRSI